MRIDDTPVYRARFWAKVDKAGPIPTHRTDLGPCWVWTGSRPGKGYGKFGTGGAGRNAAAHRVSWFLEHGVDPGELWVLHHCDNPPCVRPDHLFLGDNLTNVADRNAKGRNRGPDLKPRYKKPKPPRKGPARGEGNPAARLTAELVVQLRLDAESGMTISALSRKYTLARSSIRDVIARTTWAHIV